MTDSDPNHRLKYRDEDAWIKCHTAGRGTSITKGLADDLNFCPFCGDQLRDALPAYLRDDEPEDAESAADRAEIEAERKLDERRERHFDRNGHFGPGRPDPGPD